MKKIASLFKRHYDGDRLVYDEVVEGSEWVLDGEGVPTEKYDGTSCMIMAGKLYKRFDRKRNRRTGKYKAAPEGWIACEATPDKHTGHWPGWLLVGDGPEDQWHREALHGEVGLESGTYELVGPKIQGNPYEIDSHRLWLHGDNELIANPRTFDEIQAFLKHAGIEGIVWHLPNGHMVKIKAKDFGLEWPSTKEANDER
jgi:hypothetical protein